MFCYVTKTMNGQNLLSPNRYLLLPPELLKLIFFAIIFLQQKHLSTSTSINTTLTKDSKLSNKEDVEQFSKDLPNDISLRRHFPRCGGIFNIQPGDLPFRIYSPDYPLPYPSLLNCIYDIRFEHRSFPCHLDLRFEDFYLDSEPPDCFGDRLEVAGLRFCGGFSGVQRFETEWTSNGGRQLVLRLVTDAFSTGRGFKICVAEVPCFGPPPIPPLPPHPPLPPVIPPPPFPSPNPPFYPPVRPPWYPPYKPPYIPPRPTPPLYPPPMVPPWISPLPLCCGTQYQGHHIYFTSPGFPRQLPGGIDCGYVINRLNPRVTHLRVTFKYFFLPCPWTPLGVQYPSSSKGYLSIDGRNFCGCQSGLSVIIPFARLEVRKILRLQNPSFYRLSRSVNDNISFPYAFKNSSSSSSSIRKTNSDFKPSPPDIFLSGIAQNSQLVRRNDQTATHSIESLNRPSTIIFPSSGIHVTHNLEDSSSSRTQNLDGQNFHFLREPNSTYFPLSKSDKTFTSLPYNHHLVVPASGFLLEVIQEELPYFPAARKSMVVRNRDDIDVLIAKSDSPSLPNMQNASSRLFHLSAQSCGVNDLPWLKWWLLWLHKKQLLQVCPLTSRPPLPPVPPPIRPPFC